MKIQVYSAVQLAQIHSLFNMGGHVLNFTDPTFANFTKHAVNISVKERYGLSKGKSLDAFFFDNNVPYAIKQKLLGNLLEYYELVFQGELTDLFYDLCLVSAYTPKTPKNLKNETVTVPKEVTESDFLALSFSVNIDKLGLDNLVADIIKQRIAEVEACIKNNIPLSAVFMIGSILEGILLNVASSLPKEFNTAQAAPKDENRKAKKFHKWTLSSLIDASHEVGILKEDVKKFSYGVRDFRNYIHPYEQMVTGFSPDQHTALICFQVLNAAIFQVEVFRSK